jgi:amino acid transporter
VSISAIALVPADRLSEGETPLLQVVQAGAPGFPLGLFGVITMFAVANTALINMLMASRLVYGLGREGVLPPFLSRVHARRRTPVTAILFTTALAFGLITFVGEVPDLGGTTALLLLMVFTVVNVAVLVLRRRPIDGDHFRTPTVLPVIGALACAYLASPFAGRPVVQYKIAGVLLAIGVVLWGVTVLINRTAGRGPARRDPEALAGDPAQGPRD